MNKTFPWWNPLGWVDMILQALGAMLHSILAFFGMLAPPSTDGHQNIQIADVEAEKKTAEEQQAAVDHLQNEMTPAEIVHAYCKATEDERRLMNLEKLSAAQQDWLMRLSDRDLVMLGASGEDACGRSVEALRLMVSKSKLRTPEIEAAPVVLPIPSTMQMTDEQKEEFVRDRFNELFYSLSAANMNPKVTPGARATVH
ncbi:hypothetical protein FY140_17615 [Agrobacterium tumefaciens]|uniref:hypothetical protein n=1 Tax=Agrobacterium tumefaciens TaxID=358 RepID=UPI0021D0895B|nr:hypothetical protein [Agrobacterium tumefaciens]UXT22535.1 hypothetical protein FY140_17615 [Agrobacterium tumefaciens]